TTRLRTFRQPAGDPVVEPGGGAAVAAGDVARGPVARRRRLGLAPCRHLFRAELAAVRMDGGQPVLPVVAARGAALGPAGGAARRFLADAAARGAGQAAGAAAVAAAAGPGP